MFDRPHYISLIDYMQETFKKLALRALLSDVASRFLSGKAF